jgi:hypothetical protein
MRTISKFSSASILVALLGVGSLVGLGCGSAEDDDSTEQSSEEVSAAERAKIKACNLDDGTVEMTAHVRACKPGDTKKTTICHVPPGNPANAHTLCIGNAAVKHHLANHPDYLGPCKVEKTCPPPPPSGAGGASGAGGIGGVAGQGGSGTGGIGGIAGQAGSGSGGAPGTGGMVPDGGTPGTGGSFQIVE